eukprot:SM004939S17354  [mRNA]  locus=s4939:95:1046:- [translate_table: standard]
MYSTAWQHQRATSVGDTESDLESWKRQLEANVAMALASDEPKLLEGEARQAAAAPMRWSAGQDTAETREREAMLGRVRDQLAEEEHRLLAAERAAVLERVTATLAQEEAALLDKERNAARKRIEVALAEEYPELRSAHLQE